MNTNTVVWLLAGAGALIVLSVVVNIAIINPKAEEAAPVVKRVGIYNETRAEREARKALCNPVQTKIYAEIAATGKRGTENFSLGLQNEIRALKGKCRFIGDEEGF